MTIDQNVHALITLAERFYESTVRRSPESWDTLNEIEDAIAAVPGETSEAVNQRLMKRYGKLAGKQSESAQGGGSQFFTFRVQ